MCISPPCTERSMGCFKLRSCVQALPAAFAAELEEHLQPKAGEVGNFVALLHEPDRDQIGCQVAVQPQLRLHAGKQHGFAHPARRDDQCMLARCGREIALDHPQYRIQFPVPDHKLFLDLLIRLERAWIELADGRG